jgi:hypothetical protein
MIKAWSKERVWHRSPHMPGVEPDGEAVAHPVGNGLARLALLEAPRMGRGLPSAEHVRGKGVQTAGEVQ